jgi:hypothetical protein
MSNSKAFMTPSAVRPGRCHDLPRIFCPVLVLPAAIAGPSARTRWNLQIAIEAASRGF